MSNLFQNIASEPANTI